MKKEVNNVPELRFPEFGGEWSFELLENLSVRGSGHTPNKNFPSYYNGEVKWVSLADSNKLDNGYIEETKVEISKEGLKKSSAVLHPPETVLLSRDAGVGKSAVMKREMAVSQHFIVWRPKPNLLATWFLYYSLQILKREFERIAIGNTIKTIGLPYFKKLKINSPTFQEQQKIASFLSAVDKKIEQLSRKKELLEQYKKGVMQKVFSQEIRFKDDNGQDYPDWEEKRLNRIVKPIKRKSDSPVDAVLTISAGNGFLHQKERFSQVIAGSSLEKYTLLKENEFSYNRGNSKSYTYGCIYKLKGYKKALVPNIYRSFSLNTGEPEFYEQLFIGKYLDKQLRQLISSSARMDGLLNIGQEDFYKCKVPCPCLEEQKKIGEFLKSIDIKITTTQSHLTQTQNFKKGLLQKMFV